MGKLVKNRVSPNGHKPMKDNWTKERKDHKNKDAGPSKRTSFFNTKQKSEEVPVKINRVKDDPFFVSQSPAPEKPSSSSENLWNKNLFKNSKTSLFKRSKTTLDDEGFRKTKSKSSLGNEAFRMSKNNLGGGFFNKNNKNSKSNLGEGNAEQENYDGGERRKSLSSWKSKSSFFNNKSKDQGHTSSKFVASPAAKTSTSTSTDSPRVMDKKPFDKKKWRMQKYSKRLKLDQWEEKRKKAILRNYFKDVKGDDDKKKFDVQKIYENASSDDDENDDEEAEDGMAVDNENNLNANIQSERDFNKSVEFTEEEGDDEEQEHEHKRQQQQLQQQKQNFNNSQARKGHAYKNAKLEYERLKNESKLRKQEIAQKRKERDEALKIYKEKKVEKFKKLSRRTKKGQPIMNDQIEVLLEKIQKNIGQQQQQH